MYVAVPRCVVEAAEALGAICFDYEWGRGRVENDSEAGCEGAGHQCVGRKSGGEASNAGLVWFQPILSAYFQAAR